MNAGLKDNYQVLKIEAYFVSILVLVDVELEDFINH